MRLRDGPYAMAEPDPDTPPGGGGPSELDMPRPGREAEASQVSLDEVRAMRQELTELRGMRDGFDSTRQELARMREQFGQIERVFNPQRGQDPNTEYYLNPGQMVQRTAQEMRQQVLTELEERMAQRDWWGRFYSSNQDLDSDEGRDLVRLAILRSPQLQQSGFTSEAQALLATEARKLAMAYGSRFGGGGGQQPPVRLVESGGGTRRAAAGSGQRQQGQEDDAPLRVGEIIRQQRLARQRRTVGE